MQSRPYFFWLPGNHGFIEVRKSWQKYGPIWLGRVVYQQAFRCKLACCLIVDSSEFVDGATPRHFQKGGES